MKVRTVIDGIDERCPDVSYVGYIPKNDNEPGFVSESKKDGAEYSPPIADEDMKECGFYNICGIDPGSPIVIDYRWWGEATSIFDAALKAQEKDWWTQDKWDEVAGEDGYEELPADANVCHYLVEFGGYEQPGNYNPWPQHYVMLDASRKIRRHYILPRDTSHDALLAMIDTPVSP